MIQHEEFIKNGGGLEEVDEDLDQGLGEETEARELLLSDPKLWKVSRFFVGDDGEIMLGVGD